MLRGVGARCTGRATELAVIGVQSRAHPIYTSLYKSYLSTIYSKALFIYSLLLKPLRYQRS